MLVVNVEHVAEQYPDQAYNAETSSWYSCKCLYTLRSWSICMCTLRSWSLSLLSIIFQESDSTASHTIDQAGIYIAMFHG